MEHIFLQFLVITIFLTVVFFACVQEKFNGYNALSRPVSCYNDNFALVFFDTYSILLLAVALLTFAVKAVIAPLFFARLVRKHQLKFSASTYLNLPTTLIMVAAPTAVTSSHIFAPLVSIIPENEKYYRYQWP